VVKLKQSWQCGYCKYSGWHTADGNYRCEPLTTKNTTGDRIGVRTVDGQDRGPGAGMDGQGRLQLRSGDRRHLQSDSGRGPAIESIDLVLSSRMAKP